MSAAPPLRRLSGEVFELLGSMRFAVSLLVFICIASIIGTVLQQGQVANTYIDRFGLFWYELFDLFSIWQVYSSWWFLAIMAFLVVSTTLCLLRNTPKMLRDVRSFRDHVRVSSLRAFPHKVQLEGCPVPPDTLQARLEAWLGGQGYRYRIRKGDDGGTLIAAKKGGANRLGYVFAHTAIVVICVGGLLDSNLPVRLQVWFGGKQPITENMLISQVPASGRLAVGNPSFRGTMLVPEGAGGSNGLINVDDGVLVQPLPFGLTLKRFVVDYYDTGMPSNFRSEVEVSDLETGETFERDIEVNHPLRYKGVTVYQSSFDDGGSRLQLTGFPLVGGGAKPFEVQGVVGESTDIEFQGSAAQDAALKVGLTALRMINVENLVADGEPQPRPLREHVAAVTGSARGADNTHMRNVGPSVQYRLTGTDGQAHEFTTYMLPVELDGVTVFLAGVRQGPSDTFRYVRIPADEAHSLQEFMDLRAALADPALLRQAVQRFAARNETSAVAAPMLERAAYGAMESFARGGFNAIVDRAPEAEREKILSFVVPMLQFSLADLRDIMRERTGREPVQREGEAAAAAGMWLQSALLALANLPDYPAPVLLTLKTFEHVQASVFQVTRSPGAYLVYLGCLFLVLGVFAMFYIRDRRVWAWITPAGEGGSTLRAAMTSQRRTLDFQQEFGRFQQAAEQLSSRA